MINIKIAELAIIMSMMIKSSCCKYLIWFDDLKNNGYILKYNRYLIKKNVLFITLLLWLLKCINDKVHNRFIISIFISFKI